MNADSVFWFYGFICGQDRCFIIDGTLLPLCQRCLGLYLGALLTAVWLAATGLWRRGMPHWGVLAVHLTVLLAALLGGLHVIDPGPVWRLTCGLWTGHVLTFWLVGASFRLWHLARPTGPASMTWRRSDVLQGLAVPLVLPLLAVAFPLAMKAGWEFWTGAALLGTALLGLATLAALLVAGYYLVKVRRRSAK